MSRSTRPARTPRALPALGRRSLLLGVGGVLVGGALSACSQEEELPPAPPTGPELAVPTPLADSEQFSTYVAAVNAAIVAADEALDADALAPRVTGSAASFRKSLYAMITEDDAWKDALATPSAELVIPMTSTSAEFPRTVIGLVSDSVDSGVPFFMALQQQDAKSPYTAWGWAQQAQDVDMPTVPSDLVGSATVAIDEAGLISAPGDALALYAKVLSDGTAADADDLLADNPYQTSVHAQIQAEREMLNNVKNAEDASRDEYATIKEVYTVTEGEFAGLRTDDGGALVIATLTSQRTMTLLNEATVTLDSDNEFYGRYVEIIGTSTITGTFTRTFGTTVALYIPSEEAGGQIQPIGATRIPLGATVE
ncbi:hypothetical protein ACXET9_06790 [Brachybacterium sp. DNPG3]